MFGIKQRGRKVPTSGPTLTQRWRAAIDGHVIALRWSLDGRWLAAASADGPIALFAHTGEAASSALPGHALGTAGLDWQPNGALLASAGHDGHIRVWDVAAGKGVRALRAAAIWAERVVWHPGGHMLAGAAGRSVRLWDTDGTLLREWRDHESTVADLAWKPDGSALAAVAYGGTTLWSPTSDAPQRRYAWKGSSLVLEWSPDGALFATGDQDSTVHFWYADTGHDLQMWGYETKMRELAWDPSSRYLATGGGRDAVVWDVRAGKNGPEGSKPVMLGLHEAFVSALAYQHTGVANRPALLASAGQDGLMALWQPTAGRRPLAQFGFNTPVSQLVWSPDDTSLAVGCADGTVAVLGVE